MSHGTVTCTFLIRKKVNLHFILFMICNYFFYKLSLIDFPLFFKIAHHFITDLYENLETKGVSHLS